MKSQAGLPRTVNTIENGNGTYFSDLRIARADVSSSLKFTIKPKSYDTFCKHALTVK